MHSECRRGNTDVGGKQVPSELRYKKDSGRTWDTGARMEGGQQYSHSEVMIGGGFSGKEDGESGTVLVGRIPHIAASRSNLFPGFTILVIEIKYGRFE